MKEIIENQAINNLQRHIIEKLILIKDYKWDKNELIILVKDMFSWYTFFDRINFENLCLIYCYD